MKIALIGYGKMGKEIEKAAIERGHDIVLRITSVERPLLNKEKLTNADVAIEFTRPDSAVSNIRLCYDSGVPVVTGTTGWYQHLDEVSKLYSGNDQSLLYASNFSLGVNILFELNRKLAQTMSHYKQYVVSIDEIHHLKKLDAPSGTAISLANDIINNNPHKLKWVLADQTNVEDPSEIVIHSSRIGETTGTHTVKYTSANDILELRHEALNRSGFAIGAVIAAEWIIHKKGIFTMSDVLKFNT